MHKIAIRIIQDDWDDSKIAPYLAIFDSGGVAHNGYVFYFKKCSSIKTNSGFQMDENFGIDDIEFHSVIR
jgi:hypothetical protein